MLHIIHAELSEIARHKEQKDAIAHRHGLSIRCESTVGEGTCFDIANN